MIDAGMTVRKLILGAAHYSGASTLAVPFLGGVGAILMLHRVNRASRSPVGLTRHLTITPDFLDRLLADLKRQNLTVVSLDEMLEGLRNGIGSRIVSITADDGWLDNLTEALPVLETHGAPFTVYVTPGLATGEVDPWWEALEELVERSDEVLLPTSSGFKAFDCRGLRQKREAASRLKEHLTHAVAEEDQQEVLRELGAVPSAATPRRFMNWDEVRRLDAHPLATIGAHTIHHYNLGRLAPESALREMMESAEAIEVETGRRPLHFAYPYGHQGAVGPREVALAREAGFASAVTTRHGVIHAGHGEHFHALPRISVNGNFQRLSYVRALLSGLIAPLANRGRKLVTV